MKIGKTKAKYSENQAVIQSCDGFNKISPSGGIGYLKAFAKGFGFI